MDDGSSIDWQRGWVSPDGALPLFDDAWLPEDDWLQYVNSGVITLEGVRDLPGLVLLGEPGSGKSVCLRQEWTVVEATKPPEDATQFVDLGLAMDARDLRERVFDHPVFVGWTMGAGRLHLFLDGLDEAKVQIRRVVALLVEGLSECDMSRLVLRITCRTADRPADLERWLAQAFGDGRSRTLELAPLRLSETKAMAMAWEVEPDPFVTEVGGAAVQPLAARPLTLKMLLRVFAAEGGFPDTFTALYRQALLLMAGEEDDERRRQRRLTDTAAFAVAARIAAATVLAGRDAIGAADRVVQLRDLSGGTETDRLTAADIAVPIDESAISEVLGTALFTARPGGVGWAHRTFGEYLAAYWLADDRLTDQQVEDLVLVDDGTGPKIVPALRNVVGWLLGLRPSFQVPLRGDDALVLAFADPSAVPAALRRELLPSLLDALDDQQLERRDLRSLWQRVGYEGIEDDLLEVLVDVERDDQTRQAAVDAVAELGLSGLLPVLLDLAADPAQSVRLRTSALYAFREFRVILQLDRIRPLALEPQIGDDDDEIKGAALDLCWPTGITAEELFAALTPEKNEALLGAYTSFLRGRCLDHLAEPDDLLHGLRWGLSFPRAWHDTRDVIIVADIIVARAWPLAATVPEIADALADLVELVTPHHQPVLTSASSLREEAPDSALDDPSANAAVLTVLVTRVADGRFRHELLSRAILRGLARTVDMAAVIEHWASASGPELQEAWKLAIAALATSGHDEALFDFKDTHPELYELVADRYEPIALDSLAAEALRKRYTQEQAELAEFKRRPPVDPVDLNRQVTSYLAAFAEGDTDAFWKLLHPLLVEDDGTIPGEQSKDDITTMPGWGRMDEAARNELIDAAEAYLRRGNPEPDRWLGQNVFFRPAHAGCCALKLLFNQRRVVFDELDVSVWRTWAPVVITQRRYRAIEDLDDFPRTALAQVRTASPDIARETIAAQIPHRLHRSDVEAAQDRLGDLWDSTLDDLLFAQLARDDLEHGEIIGVIESLLAVGRDDARHWAAAHVTPDGLSAHGDERQLALGLASALSEHVPRHLWSIVASIAREDDDATRLLLGRLEDRSGPTWQAALEPQELSVLFGILERLFPRDLDAPEERTFDVTVEMRMSWWRGRILEQLVATGTSEAVSVIAELEEQYDDNGWIRRMRHRAQEEVRRARWSPPEPAAIVRMGSDDPRRHIPDAPSLRRLLMEALNDIADRMRGAQSLAPFLWNTKPHRLPKDENEISNILAEWLRARIGGNKAIINREVQINARTAQSADRTDILVQAIAPQASEPLSVVVEVKGAWNQDLMAAMDDQLATQYLKPDLTDQGIYLVFWFSADGWEDYDNTNERQRRRRATQSDAAGLANLLHRQADDLLAARDVVITPRVIDSSVDWPARGTA